MSTKIAIVIGALTHHLHPTILTIASVLSPHQINFPFPENLALRGTATQSSTYNAQSADRAIDGVKDFFRSLSSCAVTRLEDNPWWRLDLQASYRVNIIVVTYREDCCLDRWRGVEIHFGNSLQDDGNDNPRSGVSG